MISRRGPPVYAIVPERLALWPMYGSDRFTLAGVIHLLPLPGAPRGSPGLGAVLDRALADAEAIATGGLRVVVLENFGDAPFRPSRVDPHVPALMAVIGAEIRARVPELTLGVNVLRNDARAALGVAGATGAAFVRVNVHTGATWTDQGLITGEAHETLRYRRELGLDGTVRIFADVAVKHGAPAGEADIGRLAADAFYRGGADGLIVTGAATGAPADLGRVRAVRDAVPQAEVWVGSGVVPATLAAVRAAAHGAIVGTWLHGEGRLDRPVDPGRVRALLDA